MASVKGAAKPIKIELDPATRSLLEEIARAQALPHRDVMRAKLILLVAEGHSVTEVADRVGMARRLVRKWADRFKRLGLLGLDDASRSGRPPRFSPDRGHASGEARLRAS
jgi:hypothetical protein